MSWSAQELAGQGTELELAAQRGRAGPRREHWHRPLHPSHRGQACTCQTAPITECQARPPSLLPKQLLSHAAVPGTPPTTHRQRSCGPVQEQVLLFTPPHCLIPAPAPRPWQCAGGQEFDGGPLPGHVKAEAQVKYRVADTWKTKQGKLQSHPRQAGTSPVQRGSNDGDAP